MGLTCTANTKPCIVSKAALLFNGVWKPMDDLNRPAMATCTDVPDTQTSPAVVTELRVDYR